MPCQNRTLQHDYVDDDDFAGLHNNDGEHNVNATQRHTRHTVIARKCAAVGSPTLTMTWRREGGELILLSKNTEDECERVFI